MELDEKRMDEFIRFLRRKKAISMLFSLKENTYIYSELNSIAKSDTALNYFIKEGVRLGLIRKEITVHQLGNERFEYNLTFLGLEVVKHLEEINFILCRSGDNILDSSNGERSEFYLSNQSQE